jgi:hypothetical protein
LVPAIGAQAENFDSILKHFKLPDFWRARHEVNFGFRHIQHQSAADAFQVRMARGVGVVSHWSAGVCNREEPALSHQSVKVSIDGTETDVRHFPARILVNPVGRWMGHCGNDKFVNEFFLPAHGIAPAKPQPRNNSNDSYLVQIQPIRPVPAALQARHGTHQRSAAAISISAKAGWM